MEGNLKQLIFERGLIKSSLTRFKTSLANATGEHELEQLELGLERATPLIDKFESVQDRIEFLVMDTEQEAQQGAERIQFEDTYARLISSTRLRVKQLRAENQPPVASHVTTPQIATPSNPSPMTAFEAQGKFMSPLMTIPKFDGSYNKWAKFRDTFESLVHRSTAFTDAEKFNFLNIALEGDAARIIDSLGLNEDSYSIAWESVKDNFDDPKVMVHHHVKALVNLRSIASSSPKELRQLKYDASNHFKSLNSLLPTSEQVGESIIIYLLVKKLDSLSRDEWERYHDNLTEQARLKHLFQFLEKRFKFLERTDNDATPRPTPATLGKRPNRGLPERFSSHVTSNGFACGLCGSIHALYHCEQFKALSPADRLGKARQLKVCLNCLHVGHQTAICTRGSCWACSENHHTLLHMSLSSLKSSQVALTTSSTTNSEHSVALHQVNTSGSGQIQTTQGLLSTAIVHVRDRAGRQHECRALLDPGSQMNFITTECHKKLNLPSVAANIEITGIGQTACHSARKCSLTLSSRSTNYRKTTNCIIIPSITQKLPCSRVDRSSIPIPNNIGLADPNFHASGEIDLLIGVEIFWELICVGQVKLGKNLPILQKTLLGWIIGGSLPLPREAQPRIGSCHLGTMRDLNDQLARFWEVEHCETNFESPVDPSDPCERHFRGTTTRESNGRYVVSIPLKQDTSVLGDSRQAADKRFRALERKFRQDSQLREGYTKFMNEYLQLGHMSPVSISQPDVPHPFYLPHHAVRKESSTTTKLRVVFDGSAKSSSGISLNDIQSVGPTVQDELINILLRFRKHRYVISADISKMYRQILIKPEERSLQRILWRPRESEPIRVYELNTVTYGTASASYLATRTLRQVGEQHAIKFPTASRAVLKDFYVDDLLTGSDSIEGARQLRTEISEMLQAAGFDLRKWASNEPRVLTNISKPSVEIQADKDPRTLGLVWDAHTDELKYAVKVRRHDRRASKRIILSDIAQIFDPLGLIGPAILQAKLIMQRLWQLQINWDESLPQDLASQWEIFREELCLLNKIEIPRRLFNFEPANIELHGFCDASERAYGACIYLRTLDRHAQCVVRLVCAKSRVAPLKTISLPRLELCGALLLAQLANKTMSSLELDIKAQHFWTDSMVTLAWIRSPPTKWTTFVANRAAEIQRLTSVETWRHVPTSSNPADVISRGVSPSALASTKIWWEGPDWLRLSPCEWPASTATPRDLPEVRNACLIGTTASPDVEISKRFSSFTHLIRVTAYCLRFASNIRIRLKRNTPAALEVMAGPLAIKEISMATTTLVKVVQATAFCQELRDLNKGNKIPPPSSLSDLNPFLDETGLLRVGGRLSNAPIPYTQRHPAILPSNHAFTELLIEYEHKRLLHAGCQAVICSLRSRYWVISCRNTVKKVLRKCMRCFRIKPNSTQQLMGILPSARVTPARAFHTCGVDYAGPLLMKAGSRGRTTLKGYLCLFVCFVTKAVHLELAIDLTTDAFLNCLRRFISRRGACRDIYSDNGTNFIGARNELKELATLLRNDKHNQCVAEFLSTKEIQWHLTPPRSPHFGGLWEAAIKSAKYHLKRVIGETRLTYEELYTLLTQVEACMNSRPLSALSMDPKDLNPLTPAHFLIGDALTNFPQPDLRDVKISRLSRFQHIQHMLQHFWQRWRTEYLHQLQQRSKWRSSQPSGLKPGSLVIIKEENLPPLRWRLGRVAELHPGRDQISRVATVNTSDGTLKRALNKLCLLPTEESSEVDQQ